MLSLCLKNIKGLKRVKLLDAAFVWTEPHSRRIKVKVTVQKEVQTNTMLQQTFVVEFTVTNQQCDDCKTSYTPHTWTSQVQVRQRVPHKRTMLYLEQLILRHNAHDKTIGIEQQDHGLDFQFKSNAHANRFISFVQQHFIAKAKCSRQLISTDEQNAEAKYKFTNQCEVAPICRDDLVLLEPKLSKALGGIGPLIIVYKVTTSVHIVDVHTMRTHEIDAATYWKHEFKALCSRERLKEFVVINIDNVDFDVTTSKAAARNKFRMVQLEVARKEDYGNNDKTFIVNTHLGELINYNDTVLAYDLNQITLSELEAYDNRTH